MKIGILKTDHVLEKFRSQFGEYPQMFRHLLDRAQGGLSYATYDVMQGQYPTHLDDCDAYVITGSKASVYENVTWIRQLEDFVKRLHHADKKLIAVCFGHQLVAQAFGGKTEKSQNGWGVGVHTIPVLRHMTWMQPTLNEYKVVVSHQDQVTHLPDAAILLAGNDFCPNAMFQLGSILTIQGHPEFSRDYGKASMQNRRDKIETHQYDAAMKSWEVVPDDVALAQWWLRFIDSG